jgi:hypothetical protein
MSILEVAADSRDCFELNSELLGLVVPELHEQNGLEELHLGALVARGASILTSHVLPGDLVRLGRRLASGSHPCISGSQTLF